MITILWNKAIVSSSMSWHRPTDLVRRDAVELWQKHDSIFALDEHLFKSLSIFLNLLVEEREKNTSWAFPWGTRAPLQKDPFTEEKRAGRAVAFINYLLQARHCARSSTSLPHWMLITILGSTYNYRHFIGKLKLEEVMNLWRITRKVQGCTQIWVWDTLPPTSLFPPTM